MALQRYLVFVCVFVQLCRLGTHTRCTCVVGLSIDAEDDGFEKVSIKRI